MLISNKITLALVTFNYDFDCLRRYLDSVQTHCNPDQIYEILIMLNDNISFKQDLNNLASCYTLPIKILTSNDFNYTRNAFNWNTQQYFKCVISDHIQTDWYIINDSKDHFTDTIDFFSDCFTPDNKAIVPLDFTNYYNGKFQGGGGYPFNLAFEISYDLWDIQDTTWKRWHLPTFTPFFVKTSMMKDMVSELRLMLRGFFPYLFDLSIADHRFTTEFMLYNAYCVKKNRLDDYADISYNRIFFQKVTQSKDLRGANNKSLPMTPLLNQKVFNNGYVYMWDGQKWIKNDEKKVFT
jgi:hypothetical protein